MDVSVLARFNEWWETGAVDDRRQEGYRRYLYPQVLRFLPDRQIVLITGLRRVGKTTLLYQLIEHLLEERVDARAILYFSFDEERYDLGEVLEAYSSAILKKRFRDSGKIFVFLDEIHKVSNWEGKIKTYYDLNPNIKFFLSGSAALILSTRARESLAGRIYELVLKPLTFREFCEMRGLDAKYEDAEMLGDRILTLFMDFAGKSGFPEIALEDDEEKVLAYVRSSIIERVIYRDVPIEFGGVDLELLETLVGIFFRRPGMKLNYQNLSRDLGRNRRTIMKYVHYLRFSLLIDLVPSFRPSAMAASRKGRKVYPATPSLAHASATGNPMAGESLGGLLEAFISSELDIAGYFRKGRNEVDFLLRHGDELVPAEVKVRFSEGDLSKLSSFLSRSGFKAGLALNLDVFGRREVRGVTIAVLPIWDLLLYPRQVLEELTHAE